MGNLDQEVNSTQMINQLINETSSVLLVQTEGKRSRDGRKHLQNLAKILSVASLNLQCAQTAKSSPELKNEITRYDYEVEVLDCKHQENNVAKIPLEIDSFPQNLIPFRRKSAKI